MWPLKGARNPSPLRYPGGKHAWASLVRDTIRANGLDITDFYEPFAGGASLSLDMLMRGAVERVHWVEKDPLIFAFWKCVLRRPDELCDRVWRLEVSMATWHRFQCFRVPDAAARYPELDLAVAGIFFNRTNFSGALAAGPIGGQAQASPHTIESRWNTESIVDRICHAAQFHKQIRLCRGDAMAFLRRRLPHVLHPGPRRKSLLFMDPPYYRQGHRLYRCYFRDHDHDRLATFLHACRVPWILSYDDHPEIRRRYASPTCQLTAVDTLSTVVRRAPAVELFITNLAVQPGGPGRACDAGIAERRAG